MSEDNKSNESRVSWEGSWERLDDQDGNNKGISLPSSGENCEKSGGTSRVTTSDKTKYLCNEITQACEAHDTFPVTLIVDSVGNYPCADFIC